MTKLTQEDRKVFRELRTFGVLEDIADHRLDQRNGVILVTCGDADRFFDIFTKQVKMQNGQCPHPRVHLCAWNGGALRLAPHSPVNRSGRTTHLDCLDEVREARRLKAINTIALYAHAPCDKARLHGLDLTQIMTLLMRARMLLKETFKSAALDVATFLHVHHADNRERSYFVSNDKWREYLLSGNE